jgi:hypothetical protein
MYGIATLFFGDTDYLFAVEVGVGRADVDAVGTGVCVLREGVGEGVDGCGADSGEGGGAGNTPGGNC